ncbi:hypothetical protein Ccrd_001995 [Cynara cardunculus var. scolymus]|uniref:Uncharacterized protein n=1 Tax=Cynara cardunculus var. scolymus TaxID=59895 RepID=A0A118JWM0_CYNCS|nr:hypothetical protein Ccrd_001995 [Cynara cardunculus var. scolymus]
MLLEIMIVGDRAVNASEFGLERLYLIGICFMSNELVTKVMARMASADIMCVGSKVVREKFSGIIRNALRNARKLFHL